MFADLRDQLLDGAGVPGGQLPRPGLPHAPAPHRPGYAGV